MAMTACSYFEAGDGWAREPLPARCPIHSETTGTCPDGCPGADRLTSQIVCTANETEEHRNHATPLKHALDQWDGRRLSFLGTLTPVAVDEAVQALGMRYPALDGMMVGSVLLHLCAAQLAATEARLEELVLHLGRLDSGAPVTEVGN